MGRVKINLTNGSVVDKPVVSSFKGTNGDYIILDNETNGSMGLPIICVSKINNNELVKISDIAEWSAVKENLKSIIAGTNLPYLSVPEVLTANDDFFTQLTLPVASFDLLKNVYNPASDSSSAMPEMPAAPVMPEVPAPPVMPEAPAVQPNVLGTPADLPQASMPIMPEVPSIPTVDPVSVTPVMPEIPVMPSIQPITSPTSLDTSVNMTPAVNDINPVSFTPVMPEVPSVPTIEPAAAPVSATSELETSEIQNQKVSTVNYDEIKANFMSACETMIDGLIDKLKNEDK